MPIPGGSRATRKLSFVGRISTINALVLTEGINSRMNVYSSAIRLCASTPLELRNFGYRFTAGADTHFSSIFPCPL
jgi:hypothetical protein